MDIPDFSITALHHSILDRLEPAPFGGLYAVGHEGHDSFYTLDTFRRLYNDAVESIRCYKRLADDVGHEAGMYRQQCHCLEAQLLEFSGD